MDTLLVILTFIWQTLLQELIVVIVGVLVANYILNWWQERRYGGWRALIRGKSGETILDRPLSANKAQALLAEPADLNVFLKGLVSPYAIVHCDLITVGKEHGVYVEDHADRRMTINLQAPYIEPRQEKAPPEL